MLKNFIVFHAIWTSHSEQQEKMQLFDTYQQKSTKITQRQQISARASHNLLAVQQHQQIVHENVIELVSTFSPDLSDTLFDEISQVNHILNNIDEVEFVRLTTEQKWQRIFSANFPSLYKIVSKFLSIPVSNAFVERVFSLCSAQWTDVRNLLKVNTVKSLAGTNQSQLQSFMLRISQNAYYKQKIAQIDHGQSKIQHLNILNVF
ncbi:hypothetical protein niasHS_012686 [Heterodera schachtii]|uniref:HAT C-terminal dimerisation domain-containing protein n=1 Tax=Heterodera schachtii TaxID=97005 RepID=A0ABD2IU20_HETSC